MNSPTNTVLWPKEGDPVAPEKIRMKRREEGKDDAANAANGANAANSTNAANGANVANAADDDDGTDDDDGADDGDSDEERGGADSDNVV